jgi:hypothetical protein
MARTGQFSGPTEPFLLPVSVLKPPNNARAGIEFSEELKDFTADLSESEKYELQKDIEDIYALLEQIRNQKGVQKYEIGKSGTVRFG